MVAFSQLNYNLLFSIMGLRAFMLIVTFVIFDDEFCTLNSCEFRGMINFMKLM